MDDLVVTPKRVKTAPGGEAKYQLIINNRIKLDENKALPINFNGNLFSTASGKTKYIPFFGAEDNWANILLEARLTSSTQNACISSISQSLIGDGLKVKNDETPNGEWVTWCNSVNNRRQNINRFLIAVGDGERTYGNQFIQITRGSFKGKKFLRLNNRSMLYCRLAEKDIDTEFQKVLISKKFSGKGLMYHIPEGDLEVIPIWSPNLFDQKKVWKRDSNGLEHTMLHFKNEVSGIDYYGVPASISGLYHQILEYSAARFNIDNFENNMILGGMLIMKSGMSPQEAQRIAREILITHVGEGKTGRIIVVASENGAEDVQFVPFNTQREGSYIDADKRWEEKIITANGWDSVLAGINRSSNFGNGSQYIRSIWDTKEATLLAPYRSNMIDDVVKPIAEIWADWFGVKQVARYEFTLQSNMPFSFMGDLDPETFYQVNEARTTANLPFDKSMEGMYLSQMKVKTNYVPDYAKQKGKSTDSQRSDSGNAN